MKVFWRNIASLGWHLGIFIAFVVATVAFWRLHKDFVEHVPVAKPPVTINLSMPAENTELEEEMVRKLTGLTLPPREIYIDPADPAPGIAELRKEYAKQRQMLRAGAFELANMRGRLAPLRQQVAKLQGELRGMPDILAQANLRAETEQQARETAELEKSRANTEISKLKEQLGLVPCSDEYFAGCLADVRKSMPLVMNEEDLRAICKDGCQDKAETTEEASPDPPAASKKQP